MQIKLVSVLNSVLLSIKCICYFNPSASQVDNGNITSDELHIGKTQLEKTIQRHLFQGSALVILRAGDKPGKIELSVAGEKMKAKKLVLNTK